MIIIGGNQAVCPRGFICVNNYNLLIILVVIIIGLYMLNKQVYLSIYNKMLESRLEETDKKDMPNIPLTNPEQIQQMMNNSKSYGFNNQGNGAILENPFNNSTRNNHQNNTDTNNLVDIDRVLLNDRLYPPHSRNYYMDQSGIIPRKQMGMPINIETRGSGGDFSQIGILSKQAISNDEKTPGNNTDSSVLPLFGKPTYRGSSKWLYYTETDKYNPIKIPINVNNRDCTDDLGCDELYDNSEVEIPSYNGAFKVKIYKFNKPRYIPIDNPKEILPLPFT